MRHRGLIEFVTVDEDAIIDYIKWYYLPESIYDDDSLGQWARENGYVKEAPDE